MAALPEPPAGARADGRRLWAATVERFELEERELALLRQAVGLVDVLAELRAAVERDGVLLTDARGEVRTHPAAVEGRLAGLALARVLAALRLPEEDGEELPGRRPQRRAGARGVYRLPGAAS